MQRSNHQCLTAILAVACTFAGVTLTSRPARAIATPGQKCSAAKMKAAGKKAKAQLGCYAKATLQGGMVDQACLTKAGAALFKAFQKAEQKGGCATVTDAAAIESMVDGFVAAIAAALPAVPPPTPTLTITPGGTPATATPSATITQTRTPTSIQSPPTGTSTPIPTATATPTVTRTPTLTATPTPGSHDCCQAGPFCGPPSSGACPGGAVVFNASCSGSSGQCVTFTPLPTHTATPTSTTTATPTATATKTPTCAAGTDCGVSNACTTFTCVSGACQRTDTVCPGTCDPTSGCLPTPTPTVTPTATQTP